MSTKSSQEVSITQVGLTEKEYELYQILLRLGEVPVNKLISESKLKRATVYKSLYNLQEKGLVQQTSLKGKIAFKPEQPAKLLELADRQYQALERARNDLRSQIPFLNSQFLLTVEKPVVTTFEGVEGLKQIYLDTLAENKEIFATLQTAEVEPELFKWLNGVYVKKRKEQGLKANVIVASGAWSQNYERQMEEGQLGETVVIPSDKFPFKHEVDIYGDKVAFINFKKGEPLIGIIIHHPLIAQTMKAWFDLAWEGALKYDKQGKPLSDSPAVIASNSTQVT